jgi:hypothetical protein
MQDWADHEKAVEMKWNEAETSISFFELLDGPVVAPVRWYPLPTAGKLG